MKWQAEQCGQNAWKSSDCFLKLGMANDSLAADWKAKFSAMINKEMQQIRDCFDQSPHDPHLALYSCHQMGKMTPVELHMLLEDESHLARGIYVDQIANWMRHFPPSQFLFLSSEDFDENPQIEVKHFVEWMELDPALINSKALDRRNRVRAYPDGVADMPDLDQLLRDFYRPHNQRLFDLLEQSGHQSIVPTLRRYFE